MYVSFEDIKKYVSKTKGRCYEPDDVTIDDDGDIIIRI